MAATSNTHKNRYRTIRSAILTGSVLSMLPLLALMKSAAGGGASVEPVSAQVVAVAATPTQTASSQTKTTTRAVATPASRSGSTSSSTTKTTAKTHTRTKAS